MHKETSKRLWIKQYTRRKQGFCQTFIALEYVSTETAEKSFSSTSPSKCSGQSSRLSPHIRHIYKQGGKLQKEFNSFGLIIRIACLFTIFWWSRKLWSLIFCRVCGNFSVRNVFHRYLGPRQNAPSLRLTSYILQMNISITVEKIARSKRT